MKNSALNVVEFFQPKPNVVGLVPASQSPVVSRNLAYVLSDAAMVQIPKGCSTGKGPSRVLFRRVRLQVEITSSTSLIENQYYAGRVLLHVVEREDGTVEFVIRVEVDPELTATKVLSLSPAKPDNPQLIGGALIGFRPYASN